MNFKAQYHYYENIYTQSVIKSLIDSLRNLSAATFSKYLSTAQTGTLALDYKFILCKVVLLL